VNVVWEEMLFTQGARCLVRTSQLSIGTLLARTTVDELEQGLAACKRLEEGFEGIGMIDHASIVQSSCKTRLVGIDVNQDLDVTGIRN